MKVFVNDVEINIFEGARVIDAAHKFINMFELFEKLRRLSARDAWNNRIDLDGELQEGSRIYLD
ncbi:MAG: hypothetical protein ACTTKO_09900 [Candidatus Limimorpha sp.]